jgi:hypothetical protein
LKEMAGMYPRIGAVSRSVAKNLRTRATARRIVMSAAVAITLVAWITPARASSVGEEVSNLSTKLLSVSQMPGGWSVLVSQAPSSGCLAQIPGAKGVKPKADANVTLWSDPNFYVQEELVVYSVPAKEAMTRILSGFNACRHFSTKSLGKRVTGSFKRISLPHYGDQSRAFDSVFTFEHAHFSRAVSVARLGDIIMVISTSVDLGQFQKYVSVAVAKVLATSSVVP